MRKLMTAAAAAALIALTGCGEEAVENDANEELGQTTEEVEDAVNESAPAGVDSDESGNNLDGPNAEIETDTQTDTGTETDTDLGTDDETGTDIGDTETEVGPFSPATSFEDNHAVGVGMKIADTF